ncbi:MAG: thioredoxin family protein [Methanobacteriota archaeon]
MTPSSVEAATAKNFRQIVLESEVPVVVDFWAPWCGWCRKLAPELPAVAAALGSGIRVVTLNVDDEPGLAETHGVQGLPTLKIFCGGEAVSEIVGYLRPQSLEMAIREAVRQVPCAAQGPT